MMPMAHRIPAQMSPLTRRLCQSRRNPGGAPQCQPASVLLIQAPTHLTRMTGHRCCAGRWDTAVQRTSPALLCSYLVNTPASDTDLMEGQMERRALKTRKQSQGTESPRAALLGRVAREGLSAGPHWSRDVGGGRREPVACGRKDPGRGVRKTQIRGRECTCESAPQQRGHCGRNRSSNGGGRTEEGHGADHVESGGHGGLGLMAQPLQEVFSSQTSPRLDLNITVASRNCPCFINCPCWRVMLLPEDRAGLSCSLNPLWLLANVLVQSYPCPLSTHSRPSPNTVWGPRHKTV